MTPGAAEGAENTFLSAEIERQRELVMQSKPALPGRALARPDSPAVCPGSV